jgi:pimeloyl-ACP methyl ester carboxylesterase
VRPERFRIEVPDADLDDLRKRLAGTRWPGDLDNDSWQYGTNEVFLRELVGEWQDDDWRRHERALNEVEHYRVELDGQLIHYVHVPRPGRPVLLLIHGWPSTHWDFARLIPRLEDFELVIPDLPGYAFSSPLRVPRLGYVAAAELLHALLTGPLGHDRYGVYGADWGALVAEQIAYARPGAVLGLHTSMPFPLDFAPVPSELWADDEIVYAERTREWVEHGMAYFHLMASKPQTIAYLNDSPAALASWVAEKLHAWSDHAGDVYDAYPREQTLTLLSLYWLTGTFGSAARFYAESLRAPAVVTGDSRPVIAVPTGVAAFPKENTQVPRRWVEDYFQLTRYTRLDHGGHFAAVENPDALAAELHAFFTALLDGR